METNLVKYEIEESLLIKEITANKLTCVEAQDRCKELFKLIPVNIELNPMRLNLLMYWKYSKSPDWAYSKLFKIETS